MNFQLPLKSLLVLFLPHYSAIKRCSAHNPIKQDCLWIVCQSQMVLQYIVCKCVCDVRRKYFWRLWRVSPGAHRTATQCQNARARKMEGEVKCESPSKFIMRWKFHTSDRAGESKRILRTGYSARLTHYQDFSFFVSLKKFVVGCQWKIGRMYIQFHMQSKN